MLIYCQLNLLKHISIKFDIGTFSFKIKHLKISSTKWHNMLYFQGYPKQTKQSIDMHGIQRQDNTQLWRYVSHDYIKQLSTVLHTQINIQHIYIYYIYRYHNKKNRMVYCRVKRDCSIWVIYIDGWHQVQKILKFTLLHLLTIIQCCISCKIRSTNNNNSSYIHPANEWLIYEN